MFNLGHGISSLLLVINSSVNILVYIARDSRFWAAARRAVRPPSSWTDSDAGPSQDRPPRPSTRPHLEQPQDTPVAAEQCRAWLEECEGVTRPAGGGAEKGQDVLEEYGGAIPSNIKQTGSEETTGKGGELKVESGVDGITAVRPPQLTLVAPFLATTPSTL